MTDQARTTVPLDEESASAVLAQVSDAVFALDEEGRLTFLNDSAEQLLQSERETLHQRTVWELFPDEESTFREECTRALTTQESVTFETRHQRHGGRLDVHIYPSETGVTVHVRGGTEQVQRQNELQERERALQSAYEVIADQSLSLSEQIPALLRIVREAVGTEHAALTRIEGERNHFDFVDAEGDSPLQSGDTLPLQETICERVMDTNRTVVLNDIESEAPELADRPENTARSFSYYLGAPVTVEDDTYGSFCFYGKEARDEAFTSWEVTFVDLLSNWVSSELGRERYNEQLTALNELYEVAHNITNSVVDQATREGIESTICTHLAEADSYSCAWFGTIDERGQRVVPRVAAGFDGDLDDLETAYDTAEDGPSPVGEAVQTARANVVRNLRERPEYGDWYDLARQYGFDSWAVVPVTHEGALYGVLNVYSARPNAFDDRERVVIEKLGTLVGHAVTAIQRKRTLMDETLVEVEFSIKNVLGRGETSGSEQTSVTFDRIVPLRDGDYILYGEASESGIEMLQSASEEFPSWDPPEVVGESGEGVWFELHVTDPPVISVVAARGGRVESASIENGDYRLLVQLPQSADVRALVDDVRDSYPSATMLAQRQTSGAEPTENGLQPTVLDELTERQRAAVESAFHSGFFEWPRRTTGEEIASTWDVSASTYHQHLRVGEQKILAAIFDDDG